MQIWYKAERKWIMAKSHLLFFIHHTSCNSSSRRGSAWAPN